MAPSSPFSVTVHPFQSPTKDACAYEMGLSTAKNAFVFVGGLGDGPHTVPYARAIAKQLEAYPQLSFSVFEFRLKSSFTGFGFVRLKDDVADIAALVKYLRGIGKQRIILMGHSTGTQDLMEYVSPAYPDHPAVDGFILQAPVSDIGAIAMSIGEDDLEESVKVAKALIKAGRSHERMSPDLVPHWFPPVSVQRYYALAAYDGEDNYFSHDLPREVARSYWQRMQKPLLILQSGEDQFMLPSINKKEIIEDWKKLCRPGIASDLSGVIPGANHRVEQPDSEKWLIKTVIKFLESIEAANTGSQL